MSKIFNIIIAILLITCVVGVMGYVTNGFTDWSFDKIFKPDKVDKDNSGGAVVEPSESNGVELRVAMASSSANSYVINATVKPDNADNKNLTWTVAFKNPSSSWANGKTATDYVTVTAGTPSTTATVTCKQAFGEQIIVKATSVADSSKYATCTVDYKQSVDSVNVTTLGEFKTSGAFVNIPTIDGMTNYSASFTDNSKYAIIGLLNNDRNYDGTADNASEVFFKFTADTVSNSSAYTIASTDDVKMTIEMLPAFATILATNGISLKQNSLSISSNERYGGDLKSFLSNFCNDGFWTEAKMKNVATALVGKENTALFKLKVSCGDYSTEYSFGMYAKSFYVNVDSVTVDNNSIVF